MTDKEKLLLKAKRYALAQVLATTDTNMTEQAYLSLRIFNGYDVACAYKDGAESMKLEMLIEFIEGLRQKFEKEALAYQKNNDFIHYSKAVSNHYTATFILRFIETKINKHDRRPKRK